MRLMPELPEVETVRRKISPHILGRTVINILVNNRKVISFPDVDVFLDTIKSRCFIGTSRRGKFLIFHMEGGYRLILHLRMTGCLLATPGDHPMEPHTHIVFHLDDGTDLRYSDVRRFGRFWLLSPDDPDIPGLTGLGPEPYDACITGQYLHTAFLNRRRSVKECLLDQHIISGIGNIYSDEILHSSGILPFRNASDLTLEECDTLAHKIRSDICFFLEKNSISDEDYLAGRGKDYRNTPYLRAYGRSGKPCLSCGGVLIKTVVGQRGSVYCPRCQH
jgi:formamidopyrimidine-DNA glycosylase